jgi:hypothetical protein
MDDMNAFERQVARDAARDVGPVRPVDDLAIFNAITTTRPSKWRFQSMFSATKFVVAGVIVALFGGFLLTGVLTQKGEESVLPAGASASPEAIPSDSFTLPAEIPEGIESGSLDTPLGPARWVHLQGDHTTMPDDPALLPAPGGYVVLDESPPELWSSPDLFTWTKEPLPFREAEWARLTLANGIYWLSTGDTVTLWRSTDAVDWEQIDATGLVPPGPPGLYQATGLGVPAMSGDITIATVDYEPVQFKTYFGLPDERGHTNLEETEPGLYQATSKYGVDLATLRFEETDKGLTVIDDADGSVRAELEGVGLDLIDLWAANARGDMGVVDLWAVEHGLPSPPRQIAYVDDDKLVPMDLPASPIGSEPPALFGTDAGFFLYTLDSDGLLRVRRSEDGRAWSEAEVLGDDEGEPSGVWAVEGQPQSVVAYGDAMEEWRSTDGTTWEVTREFGDPNPNLRLGSSWISLLEDPQGVLAPNLRFRSDDGEITYLDVSELSIKHTSEGAGGSSSGVLSDNTLFYAAHEEEGTREHDVWIITFDELPA